MRAYNLERTREPRDRGAPQAVVPDQWRVPLVYDRTAWTRTVFCGSLPTEMLMMMQVLRPTDADLDELFRLKYGEPEAAGWGPSLRRKFGYFTPDDYYEALVAQLVTPGCRWIDVGCGRDIFPSNRKLARALSDRCGLLVGVDPDITLDENPYVHQRAHTTMDEYRCPDSFDVVTMRMVAEHVENPSGLVEALARCVGQGGKVVIYTVNKYSPVPILTNFVPFAARHRIKRVLWGTEEKDTFPTRFRMNTRSRLRCLLKAGGFEEVLFARLDDCRTFGRFRSLLTVELTVRTVFRTVRLPYPEYCILGVYEKV